MKKLMTMIFAFALSRPLGSWLKTPLNWTTT